MNESLFDTRFGADLASPAADPSAAPPTSSSSASTSAPSAAQTPSTDSPSNDSAEISFRVLVSDKESGCLIGQNGQVIDSIREETQTKAGISRLVPGLHERILSVSGSVNGAVLALSYFAQALCNTAAEQYTFFPLKQLSSNPCVEGQSTVLRLLIPNPQIGSLIGAKGLRIQLIQSEYHISMIVSKSYLQGSNERLVELQGLVEDLSDALRAIAHFLIEDSADISGILYYNPANLASASRGPATGRGPHQSSRPRNGAGPAASVTVNIPNHMVGAMIGKHGMRIQGVRKVSGASIAISDEVEGETERVFSISGSAAAVEKAKDLLHHNYKREEERRVEFAADAAGLDAGAELDH